MATMTYELLKDFKKDVDQRFDNVDKRIDSLESSVHSLDNRIPKLTLFVIAISSITYILLDGIKSQIV